ncbi:hypothetical protein PT974_10112 [Cladobotryum mycophilum]|uniref:Uncharacterized protein n=1 Tax=Cladobotryum mycophilum TaxID=491253 RepID=A0ABR0SAE3_9HYPO
MMLLRDAAFGHRTIIVLLCEYHCRHHSRTAYLITLRKSIREDFQTSTIAPSSRVLDKRRPSRQMTISTGSYFNVYSDLASRIQRIQFMQAHGCYYMSLSTSTCNARICFGVCNVTLTQLVLLKLITW